MVEDATTFSVTTSPLRVMVLGVEQLAKPKSNGKRSNPSFFIPRL
jgi:hypothetical protein